MLAAAHSDSPSFKVREAVSSAGNCLRLSVEPYGGMVMRSWLDRPLSVAGRVMVRRNGAIISQLVDVDQDLLVIPSVAIHMDREVTRDGAETSYRSAAPTGTGAGTGGLPAPDCGDSRRWGEGPALHRSVSLSSGGSRAERDSQEFVAGPRTG